MLKSERYKRLIAWFEENVPIAETELRYDNPYQLLVAVILSAQCTDKRVNTVTPELFRRYPVPEKMAESSPEEIYTYIKSVSYPNNKAANLHKMAQRLVSHYGSVVPDTVEELTTLAGVGRKTANVVASVVYRKPAMAVDTHVFRVSARLGLTTRAKTPLQAEQQLVRHIPEEKLAIAHHWLILHGRYVCTARKPHCDECGLSFLCASYKKTGFSENNS